MNGYNTVNFYRTVVYYKDNPTIYRCPRINALVPRIRDHQTDHNLIHMNPRKVLRVNKPAKISVTETKI